jgi:hypothetical protein
MVSTAVDLEHRGPSLLAVALVYLVLSLASLVPFVLAPGGPLPSPFDAGSVIWFPQHEGATRLFALLQLGASVPLGIFAAAAVSRLRFLGVRAAGVEMAFLGGIAASILAAFAAIVAWVLAYAPGVAAHSFHVLAFGAGGVGVTVALGVFLAGISIAAGLSGLIPRWLQWLGLAAALLSGICSLTLLVNEIAYLIPITRVAFIVWILGVGATLPTGRPSDVAARRSGALVPETP